MRRACLAVLTIGMALAGCGSLRDVFSSDPETAARVGARRLEAARLAEVIGRLGGANPNPDAAELLTGVWVDLELLADRVASGGLKTDSITLDQLIWPQVAEQKVTAWHDSVVGRRAQVAPASVDSTYRAGGVGLFQHILIRASGPTAADTAKASARAEKVLPQAKSGNFAEVAARYSEDVTKSDGGYLPPGPKGSWVPEFENAAWALQPGQVSGVVRSAFGFHIIRRPPLDEIRDRLASYLRQARTVQQDSLYIAELTTRHEIRVQAGAPTVIRSTLTDLSAARNSKKELVSLRGGSFTVSDLVHWLSVLGPQQVSRLRQVNDSALNLWAKTLAQNAVLLKEADSAKVTVPPVVYRGFIQQFKADLDSLLRVTGLNAPELAESSQTPPEQRHTLAVQKVEDYFDRLTRGQARFRPVPPTLSADLRDSGDYRVFQVGISRAKELVVARKRPDSAPGATAPPPPPPGQPADTGKRP